jgi:pyruvate dehydrogenase E2 component (dihydrolipoamide acetyltransferase)
MAVDVKLPELGEGIESGDVIALLVKEGDVLAANQAILELETDKATVEVPSPHAGRVGKVHVAEGQTVPIGATLVTLETSDAPSSAAPPSPKPQPAQPLAPAASTKSETVPPPAPATPPAPAPAPSTAPPASKKQEPADDTAESNNPAAGPATRRFARELGVDLARVQGTGPEGRITREDIIGIVRQSNPTVAAGGKSEVGNRKSEMESSERAAAAAPPAGEIDHDNWGPIRREQASRIRKTIAAKMHESWSTIPRVTNFDDADITELEEKREASKEDYARSGIKLTNMPFIMKAVALALKKHPLVNASYDDEHGFVIYKDYVNLGIAVDTERGLVVPVVRSVDKLSVPEIARALAQVVQKVRTSEFGVEDLRGGTFSISNLGSVGGTYSTPIINYPEVAILLAGRARKMPVVIDDQIDIRLMMPLSLSYDHRLVDGATAARFLNDVIAYLQSPTRLLLAP